MSLFKQFYKKILINRFVKEINKDFRISYTDAFEVDIEEEHIYVTFLKNPQIDNLYLGFLKEYFNETFDMFVISLLHEIGHIMTYEEELREDRNLKYGLLQLLNEDSLLDEKELNYRYFLIPMEWEATSWGVDYYLKNKEKCEKLAKKLK